MGYKLDLKDRKLLYELDLDSSQPYGRLARKIGLSKNSVMYHINNLKKEGIIKQFHTVVDIGKLGYISFRLNLTFQNTTPEIEQEIIDFLKAKEQVAWLVSVEGKYNLASLILVKSIGEMNTLWKEILEKYQNYISSRLLTIMTSVSYFSRAYLINKKQNDYEIKFITEPSEKKIDEKDREILKLIAPNARIPIIEMARKLKVTPKTIITRIKELEKKKIILAYKTVFDYEKLGYQYVKMHLNLCNVSKNTISQFKDYIKSHPNIIYEDEVLGGDDIEIEFNIANQEELRQIIDDLKNKFSGSIRDYHIVTFYKEHKYLFLPIKL